MDKIGIKLADGSFYPILEDGKPEKKNISLTTVKDDQTTVHVDLFRSPSGTMADAQYIDTLEIDNLNPHVNGEPNLSFDIALDEGGGLSAEINDPETGRQSSRQVSLSSLAGKIAESLPSRASDLSLKDGDDGEVIDEPIELGKRHEDSNPSDDYVKEMEDIFKAPEKDETKEADKADSSFDDIVNDISNIGKNGDSQEANEVIGPSPNSESFSFDELEGGKDAQLDEVADEPIEEISAEEALPKDAEYVDSTGDEALDTMGVLDAGADQPDFGFKDLADETTAAAEPASPDAAEGADESGFEELGTLPEWGTGGLDAAGEDAELTALPSFASEEDDDKTASNDDNLDEENMELASFDADNAGDIDEPVIDRSLSETESLDSSEDTAEVAEDTPADDTFEAPALAAEDTPADDTFEAPALAAEDTVEAAEATDESLEPLDSPLETSEAVAADDAAEGAGASDDFASLDLPSLNLFEEEAVTKSSVADTDTDSQADMFADADSFAASDSFAEDTALYGGASTSDDFELPDLDFDDSVKLEADTSFELPDFDRATTSSSDSAFDDFDSTLSSTSDWPSLDLDSDSGSSATSFTPNNMFENLYDKETLEGKSSDGYEDEKRSTRVPMVVCIACAIICILCLFFLFVIPTKFNVLRRGDSQEIAMSEKRSSTGRPEGKSSVGGNGATSQQEGTDQAASASSDRSSAGDLIKPASPASVSAPLPKVESVPAKENEIVIATVPSVVVPETPVKNVKKLPDIQYTVVWGDTLWDIANAYYKNPWKYTVLAEYNHLKNPNFIQTGSILLIPAE